MRGRSRAPAEPTVALLPWGDRFEDFHDKIGVTLDVFEHELTGGWLFNYVEALQRADARPVLYYVSERVQGVRRFVHRPTGCSVRVLPAPRLHVVARRVQRRALPGSAAAASLASYLATPVAALTRELRRDGCAAILCHEYEYPRFDVGVVLGRRLGVPVVATHQGAVGPASWLERPVRALSLRFASGLVIGATDEIERVVERHRYPRSRIHPIPNPFDVERWRPLDRAAARASLGYASEARIVAWHGRVQMERKGLDVLLDAWDSLCRRRPDLQLELSMVGTGRDAEALRSRIAACRPGTVRWVDRYVTDRELLWRHLAAADAAVLPSRHEGFAVAAVEAMAAGLPVVGADAPGVLDALGTDETAAGLIVPRDDPASLSDALEQVLDDTALAAQLGANGRRRAEREFSLDVVGHRLAGLLGADIGSPSR